MNSLRFSCYSFINNILFLLIKKKKERELNIHKIGHSKKLTQLDACEINYIFSDYVCKDFNLLDSAFNCKAGDGYLILYKGERII